MLEFLEDNLLKQQVTESTREKNILDLVIVSQDHLINNNVTAGEHLGSCDHKVIRAEIITTTKVFENKTIVPKFMVCE